MSRSTLGELGEQVLLAMMHLGPESYSVPVADEIRSRTGRDVSPGTVYMVLTRLEDRGFVESRTGTSESARGGRPRRYFRVVRERALPLLRRSQRSLMALWEGLELEGGVG